MKLNIQVIRGFLIGRLYYSLLVSPLCSKRNVLQNQPMNEWILNKCKVGKKRKKQGKERGRKGGKRKKRKKDKI